MPPEQMSFAVSEATAILARTPTILADWLGGLPPRWTTVREGEGTWSAEEILGHLLHGERVDWISRAQRILSRDQTPFEPFDREAMFRAPPTSIADLLREFAAARRANLATLAAQRLSDDDLALSGTHPDFGRVTLRQLLSAWVVHDLSHVAQVARVMAKAYRDEVGPWREYLPIVDR